MSKITEAEDIPASSVECVKEDMGIFKVQDLAPATWLILVLRLELHQVVNACPG
jgi:hypothetical protein